ncbi:MAG: glycyl-radical enzyme activating protein [Planctomycetes bacterium]|nr:glycyl-radical enzyme activating protein [Planctomycetota bacterium]
MTGIIFDIKRYALHDGPGIRTTVFFQGCPLRCAWCQNPESWEAQPRLAVRADRCMRCGACLTVCPNADAAMSANPTAVDWARCLRCGACVEVCPSGARSRPGRPWSVSEVMAAVDKDRIFYDESGGGVTFSGGEPLMQSEFLLACLRAGRERDYHTAVDTCGYASPETIMTVAQWTDLFLYDLKLIDDRRHQKHLGVNNAVILDNLRRLADRGQALCIRVPLIPGINDDEENVAALAAFVESLTNQPPVHLLPYHRIGGDKYARLGLPYTLAGVEPPTPERVAQVAARFSALGLRVKVGG